MVEACDMSCLLEVHSSASTVLCVQYMCSICAVLYILLQFCLAISVSRCFTDPFIVTLMMTSFSPYPIRVRVHPPPWLCTGSTLLMN